MKVPSAPASSRGVRLDSSTDSCLVDVGASCDTAVFLRQWVQEPGTIGAIAPSSSRLARAITAPIPEHGNPVVVELGAGTGPFTTEIQRRLAGRGQHLAVELNAELAELLRMRFSGVQVLQGDARDLSRLLADRGVDHADVVISSLPWSVFGADAQNALMDAVVGILGPHSAFATFTYAHATPLTGARRFRTLISRRFEEVIPSRTVWRNLPPAFVLHARRPRLLNPA